MSVCWLRLQDCRGLNWKHAYHSLQILRNLLYHGPLAAVTEATDGLDKIRALKYYDNMRAANAQQVRSAATTVYNLVVDRAKLFSIRRFCIERRRELGNPRSGVNRDRRFDPMVPFRNLHAAASPVSQLGTRVNLPPTAPAPVQIDRGDQHTRDLLGAFTNSSGQSVAGIQQPRGGGNEPSQDLLGQFSGIALSANTPTPSAPSTPFDAFLAPVPQAAPVQPPSFVSLSAPPASQPQHPTSTHPLPTSQPSLSQQQPSGVGSVTQTFANPGHEVSRAQSKPIQLSALPLQQQHQQQQQPRLVQPSQQPNAPAPPSSTQTTAVHQHAAHSHQSAVSSVNPALNQGYVQFNQVPMSMPMATGRPPFQANAPGQSSQGGIQAVQTMPQGYGMPMTQPSQTNGQAQGAMQHRSPQQIPTMNNAPPPTQQHTTGYQQGPSVAQQPGGYSAIPPAIPSSHGGGLYQQNPLPQSQHQSGQLQQPPQPPSLNQFDPFAK